jgi:hypothetical protein
MHMRILAQVCVLMDSMRYETYTPGFKKNAVTGKMLYSYTDKVSTWYR